MCDDKTTTTKVYHHNIPLPVLKPSIPCPDSDRCDTSGFHVYPPRRSSPTIIRFCPTLGWMYLVQNITHRTAVSVVLYSPTVFTVSDRWNGTQDNLLVQTISTKIRLNTYNPTETRSMGFFHNQTFVLHTTSERSIDYSVSDSRVEFTPATTS